MLWMELRLYDAEELELSKNEAQIYAGPRPFLSHSYLETTSVQGPRLLTWYNFNSNIDK